MRIVDNFKDYEDVESFNQETTLDDDTKLLIVGTLTPPEGKDKYFYSSEDNKIYGYIDEALSLCNDYSLKNLRDSFYHDGSNKDAIKEEIMNHLKENNIAFLDVIKYAKRKKDSPGDKDIIVAELDYGAFKDLKNVKTIIVNSRAAENAFDKIIEKNKSKGIEYRPFTKKLIPQRGNGFSKRKWVEAIREGLR